MSSVALGKGACGCQNLGGVLSLFRRSLREAVCLTDDRIRLVERYMIDADEAQMREERTAAEEASRAATVHVMPTVEPRNALPPERKRPEAVGATAATLFAARLVGSVRLASVMTRRGMSFTLRRAAVIGLVVVKAAQPALSSLGAALSDEIEMSGAGDVAFAVVTVAVAVGVGVGVAFVA